VDTTGNISAFLAWTPTGGDPQTFFPDLIVSEKWTEDCAVTEHPVEQGANIVDHVRVELVRCELVIFATNEPIGPNTWGLDNQPNQPTLSALDLESPPGPTFTFPGIPIAQIWQNQLALKGIATAAADFAATEAATAIGGPAGGLAGAAVVLGGGLLGSLLTQPFALPVPQSVSQTLTTAPQVSGQSQSYTFANPVDWVELTITTLEVLKNTAQIVAVYGSKETNNSMVIESFSYVRSESEGTGAEITIGLKEILIVQTQTVNAPLPSVPRAATPVAKGPQNPADGSASQQESALHQLGSVLGIGAP
jgi:hypothetical protein